MTKKPENPDLKAYEEEAVPFDQVMRSILKVESTIPDQKQKTKKKKAAAK